MMSLVGVALDADGLVAVSVRVGGRDVGVGVLVGLEATGGRALVDGLAGTDAPSVKGNEQRQAIVFPKRIIRERTQPTRMLFLEHLIAGHRSLSGAGNIA